MIDVEIERLEAIGLDSYIPCCQNPGREHRRILLDFKSRELIDAARREVEVLAEEMESCRALFPVIKQKISRKKAEEFVAAELARHRAWTEKLNEKDCAWFRAHPEKLSGHAIEEIEEGLKRALTAIEVQLEKDLWEIVKGRFEIID